MARTVNGKMDEESHRTRPDGMKQYPFAAIKPASHPRMDVEEILSELRRLLHSSGAEVWAPGEEGWVEVEYTPLTSKFPNGGCNLQRSGEDTCYRSG